MLPRTARIPSPPIKPIQPTRGQLLVPMHPQKPPILKLRLETSRPGREIKPLREYLQQRPRVRRDRTQLKIALHCAKVCTTCRMLY